MQKVIHRSNSRGFADHGWLKSFHSFSFASYYNPQRMNFGVLRVLNDDLVAGGQGFSTHPHSNMEIISIPLSGDLEHKDSMGNTAVIREGDVQVMSAGTGIYHSEYNKNADRDVQFLQIWVIPNKQNVQPRYDQISINDHAVPNEFCQILSPSPDDQGVWIHQNAWFYLGSFDTGIETNYRIKNQDNGIYIFVLEGEIEFDDEILSRRDAVGIINTDSIHLTIKENSRLLLMEVPMSF